MYINIFHIYFNSQMNRWPFVDGTGLFFFFKHQMNQIYFLNERERQYRTTTVVLTNLSGHGKSKSLTIPKSSPVTTLRPEWETQAQVTSALSVFRDQMPTTSSPRTLDTVMGEGRALSNFHAHSESKNFQTTASHLTWSRWPR